MKLIKNIQIYAPDNLGIKDVLISDSKIEKIDDRIDKMFEEGFVSEVESLLKKYPSTIIGNFWHET